MTRVLVLGAGRVGGLIATDLAADAGLAVTVADRRPEPLERLSATAGVATRVADLADAAALRSAIDEADLVVGAVPGALGFAVLRTVIEAAKPCVDISFLPEDPLELHAAARRRGIPVVVDCGVAPGLSNLLAGREVAALDEAEEVEILVGGLPFRRVRPHEYRSVFSPADVIEEYTRPCRMRVGGRDVVRPALSGIELVDFAEVGTLESFNTDGLRSLLKTLDVPTLREKTLRWPGHAERMRMLRETGFFDETPVRVGEIEIAPRRLTESLLFRAWARPADEEEFTLLRVTVDGRRAGRRERIVWTLFDRTDAATGHTSMARTTGFPCAIVARLLAAGAWSEPGVHPPERLGRDAGLTTRLLAELERRGVVLRRTTEAPA